MMRHGYAFRQKRTPAPAMQKASEYLKHAKDCRALAKQMESGEQRDQLLKMAETWEVLARERERALSNTGEGPVPSLVGKPTSN